MVDLVKLLSILLIKNLKKTKQRGIMKNFIFLSLLLNPFFIYADISKIRMFPSGITVSFEAPAKVIPVEEEAPKKRSWRRRKEEVEVEPVPQAIVIEKFSKFIRVINSIEQSDNNKIKLVFYNDKDEVISAEIITNSVQPSAKYIFFIDRNTRRNFKGQLDIYHIPDNAQYFLVGIFDKDNNIVSTASHPNFGTDNKIQLLNYYTISPNRPSMLQIELLGEEQSILTRVGAFYFVQ